MKHATGLLCWLVILSGCGAEQTAQEYPSMTPQEEAEVSPSERDGEGGEQAAPDEALTATEHAADRKIIYTAEIDLVVDEFADVADEIPRLVGQFDGYLADSSIDRTQGKRRSGRWVARVPVARYEPFLDALQQLGLPERVQQEAQDVTEEYVDLEARIANKERLEERLLTLVDERSGAIEDIVKVEQELARVREEIERMQGRLRYLANRTRLTTVTVNVRERQDYVPPQASTFAGRVARTWLRSLSALRTFGENAAVAGVAAAPWLLCLAPFGGLLYWGWRRRGPARGVDHHP